LRIIYNLYYRFYLLLISIGEEDIPRYNAVLLLSMVNMLNLISLSMLVDRAINRMTLIALPKVYLFIAGLLVIAAHSYLIFGNKRYKQIELRYLNENTVQRKGGIIASIAYIIATIALFALCLNF
jgi:hypothetical protein